MLLLNVTPDEKAVGSDQRTVASTLSIFSLNPIFFELLIRIICDNNKLRIGAILIGSRSLGNSVSSVFNR